MPGMTTRFCIAAALLAGLSACGDKPSSEETQGTASGEVLEGTISDSMIASDKLTSQPPHLEVKVSNGGSASQGDAADENATAAAAADSAAEAAEVAEGAESATENDD
ncbi:hypothetical protein [Altericroceibacterium spongiae]|nr:hypothetical protein [Altericroceibacterium spongiae]